MKYAKRIGVLICVLAICFTLLTAPAAHADGLLGGQAAGAWIAAGLVALNIVAHTGAQAIGSYFGWQEAPSSQSVIDYAFPNATSVISDYMNAATIKVDQGVTTIDGVEYDELWIEPGTFTNGLKTNLFDFKTKWAIISGNAGTLAEGAGYYSGFPVYSVNNQLTTQIITGTEPPTNGTTIFEAFGNNIYISHERGTNDIYIKYVHNNVSSGTYYAGRKGSGTYGIRLFRNDAGNWRVITYPSEWSNWNAVGSFDSSPFKFDYVSGIVPADASDIPEDFGLSLQIPHDKLQTFYNTYPQYNVDNSVINIQQDEIDIDALTQAIFDQITDMSEVKAGWTAEAEPEPEPPGPAEDILEGVNTIIAQQNQQITQNQQQQAIQQQQLQEQQQISQDTSSIKDTIESVTQTPSSEDLPDFKFDLRELFPFCIPFDIYNLLTSFDAEPVAPHVQIPFVIQSLNFSYNIDLDFSVFDPVAQVLRTVEFIVYALGLAWATGKVIKW